MALLTFRVLSIPPLAAHLNEPPLNPTHSTDIVPSSSWKIYIDVNGGDDKVRIEGTNIKNKRRQRMEGKYEEREKEELKYKIN